jgi:hypothetical protein
MARRLARCRQSGNLQQIASLLAAADATPKNAIPTRSHSTKDDVRLWRSAIARSRLVRSEGSMMNQRICDRKATVCRLQRNSFARCLILDGCRRSPSLETDNTRRRVLLCKLPKLIQFLPCPICPVVAWPLPLRKRCCACANFSSNLARSAARRAHP